MAHDLRNHVKKCGRCRKFEAAPTYRSTETFDL